MADGAFLGSVVFRQRDVTHEAYRPEWRKRGDDGVFVASRASAPPMCSFRVNRLTDGRVTLTAVGVETMMLLVAGSALDLGGPRYGLRVAVGAVQ